MMNIIESILQDLRYSFRMLIKSPGFTIVAILSLALGIGADTAIFSLVNTTVLRPLPVQRPEQLVTLVNISDSRTSTNFSNPNYRDLRDRNNVFSGLIGYHFAPVSMSHDGINEKVWSYVITGNYFDVLGINPALGRLISTEDDKLPGGHPVVVISYQCWQDRFGSDRSVINKSIVANGVNYTIIGVAQKGFFGTEIIVSPELYVPNSMEAQVDLGSPWLEKRGSEYLSLQGRLKPGVSVQQAQAALNSIAAALEKEFPDTNQGKRIALTPPGAIAGVMRGPFLSFTGVLMMIVTFALLLACTNIANLLLARATERRKEIAIRLALGAKRADLIRQLLTESTILSAASGLVGLLLAYWLVSLTTGIRLPIDFPLLVNIEIDYRVLVFTLLVSIVTGVIFGLLPALQTTKVDLLPELKDETSVGGYNVSWLKKGMIVTQVALSLVLLVCGGLMLRALQRAQSLDLGYSPQNAAEITFDLRLQGYDNGRSREFQKTILDRVKQLPGVRYAGLADMVPVDLHFPRGSVFIEGQSPERTDLAPRAMINRVSPGYFQSIGTRILAGRDFTEQDDDKSQRVAIVNETFARSFWPGQDPIGKRFSQGSSDSPMMTVVGLVQDGKYAGLNEDPQPFAARPMFQVFSGPTTIIVRSDSATERLMTTVRKEVLQLDPHLPITSRMLTEKLSLPLLPTRFAAALLGGFGALALALAAIGIYGVMSYTVSRRTHEIGIRLALGAESSDVLRLVVMQGMMPVIGGVVIGLSAALSLARTMQSILFGGVSATDPLTYTAMALLLMLAALLACYLPARRATRVDPVIALRYE
ncbi:MAG TPA: ABC transporter permease [Blastocatellia bacterium]|nr:ABC transporter permease [Blastocatellia bacterium]